MANISSDNIWWVRINQRPVDSSSVGNGSTAQEFANSVNFLVERIICHSNATISKPCLTHWRSEKLEFGLGIILILGQFVILVLLSICEPRLVTIVFYEEPFHLLLHVTSGFKESCKLCWTCAILEDNVFCAKIDELLNVLDLKRREPILAVHQSLAARKFNERMYFG